MSVDKVGNITKCTEYEVGLQCEQRKLLAVSKDAAKSQYAMGVVAGSANNIQIAGNHYKKYGDLQPWDVVIKWNLGYLEGTALKYIARWRDKGGVEDIKKAIHFLQKLVETEEEKYGLRGDS